MILCFQGLWLLICISCSVFVCFCSFCLQECLKPLDLIRIARCLTNSITVQLLAAHLGVSGLEAEAAVYDHKFIMEAGLMVLQSFRRTVATEEEAYTKVREALAKCGLQRVDREVFGKRD